jgi:hypothetical protein
MKIKKRFKPSSKNLAAPSVTRARTLDRASTYVVKDQGHMVHVVVGALENPNYKWRTIDGLVKETGIDESTVRRVIVKLGEQVVRSSVSSTSGEDLFTTRQHHRQKESVLSRLGAVLRNRAA